MVADDDLPEKVIADRLGHSDTRLVGSLHAHAIPATLAAAGERMDRYVARATEG